MRVVIDSNVWISALVFGGNPRLIFTRAVTENWEIIVSEEIFTEVRRVLGNKFSTFSDDFEEFVLVMSSRLTYIKLGKVKIDACRDEDDNRVLETAILGSASYIVSGDKDLLDLRAYEKVEILNPKDFLKIKSDR